MKAFIWHRLEKVSTNYHPEGGLLIVAKDLERAQKMAADFMANGEWDQDTECYKKVHPIKVDKPPDRMLELKNAKEEMIVFPDAGCC